MTNLFRHYLSKNLSTTLSDESFSFIKEHFHHKYLRKRQYFLQHDTVCYYMAFVLKGALCEYTIDQNGKQHIFRFAIEEWWMFDLESFFTAQPSIYDIEALEPTEMLVIHIDSYRKLMQDSKDFREIMNLLNEKSMIKVQQRIQKTNMLDAKELYFDFVHTYPEFVQRFPQKMIASYLGISRETLSRIRQE